MPTSQLLLPYRFFIPVHFVHVCQILKLSKNRINQLLLRFASPKLVSTLLYCRPSLFKPSLIPHCVKYVRAKNSLSYYCSCTLAEALQHAMEQIAELPNYCCLYLFLSCLKFLNYLYIKVSSFISFCSSNLVYTHLSSC